MHTRPSSGPFARCVQWLRGYAFADPEQERDYQAEILPGATSRARTALLLAAGIWLVFTSADVWRGVWPAWSQVHEFPWSLMLISRVGVAVTIVGAGVRSCFPLTRGQLRWLALIVLTLFMAGTAAIVLIYAHLGVLREISVLMLITLAFFMPVGLNVQESTLAAAANIALVTVMGLFALNAEDIRHYQMAPLILAAAAGLGAVISSMREQSDRSQFQLRRALARQASEDSLTGLYNRREFDAYMDRAVHAAQREGQILVLCIIDVDHFKKYNDAHGHPAGDAVLVQVAKVLRKVARRSNDRAFRLGGEEFALLLDNPTDSYVHMVGQELLAAVRALALEHRGLDPVGWVSLSGGCVSLRIGETAEALYHRADQALYQAKQSGRAALVIQGVDCDAQTLRMADVLTQG